MGDVMKETPILFSSQMVLAVRSGFKRQTRRVIKPQPPPGFRLWHGGLVNGRQSWVDHPHQGEKGNIHTVKCKYGEVGDRLWVKETWAIMPGDAVTYRADHPFQDGSITWHPSIFMPRKLSRLTLEITNIKAERLQRISELDCELELGINPHGSGNDAYPAFINLWDSINAERGYSFASNPWVWVISFVVGK